MFRDCYNQSNDAAYRMQQEDKETTQKANKPTTYKSNK